MRQIVIDELGEMAATCITYALQAPTAQWYAQAREDAASLLTAINLLRS